MTPNVVLICCWPLWIGNCRHRERVILLSLQQCSSLCLSIVAGILLVNTKSYAVIVSIRCQLHSGMFNCHANFTAVYPEKLACMQRIQTQAVNKSVIRQAGHARCMPPHNFSQPYRMLRLPLWYSSIRLSDTSKKIIHSVYHLRTLLWLQSSALNYNETSSYRRTRVTDYIFLSQYHKGSSKWRKWRMDKELHNATHDKAVGWN